MLSNLRPKTCHEVLWGEVGILQSMFGLRLAMRLSLVELMAHRVWRDFVWLALGCTTFCVTGTLRQVPTERLICRELLFIVLCRSWRILKVLCVLSLMLLWIPIQRLEFLLVWVILRAVVRILATWMLSCSDHWLEQLFSLLCQILLALSLILRETTIGCFLSWCKR